MADNPLVSIIILNYNGASLIEECLDSVTHLHYQPIEIIVVDNNSSDNSLDVLKTYNIIKIIENKKNYGYAEGNNIGIRQCSGKYIATLNNDMTVDPLWLNEPVKILETYPDIGIISCRQMSYYKHNYIDGLYHTIKSDLTFLPYGHNHPLNQKKQYLQAGYVISANGGSAILRKDMISQIGSFDSRFFAYLDETDLCMKAFIKGWSCYYVPNAVVYHKGSVSFKKTGAIQYYYRERNRLWFLYKYFPSSFILKHFLFLLIMELRVIRVICLKLRKPDLYFKARLDAINQLSAYSDERKCNIKLIKKRWSHFISLKKRKIITV